MKISILGIKIDNVRLNEAKYFISDRIASSTKTLVVTPNPELIVEAQSDPELREVLNSADLSVPDGQGILIASRILRETVTIKEKVPGTDLAEELLKIGSRDNWRIGIVGARRGNVQEIKSLIKNLPIKISQNFKGEQSKIKNLKIEALELLDNPNDRSFDLMFACQANGIREKWMAENINKVNATVFIGVGGALDFVAGVTRRAPVLIQKLGFEWLWRLIIRPKTHLKRVWKAVFVFLWLVVKEKLRKLRN